MFKADDPRLGHRLGRQKALGPTGLGRLYRDAGPTEWEIERSRGRLRGRLGPSADEGIFSEAAGAALGEPTKEVPERPMGKLKPGPAPGPRPWLKLGISRATYWRRKKEGTV